MGQRSQDIQVTPEPDSTLRARLLHPMGDPATWGMHAHE